jgi:hypothetical protein
VDGEQATPPEISVKECLKVLLLLSGVTVGLCAGCVALVAQVGDTGSDDPSAYVEVACRDWVRAKLKAPASADFSGELAVLDDAATNRWRVEGSVDAQNSFGALVRSTWTCVATYSETEHETTLVSVDVR